MRIFFMITYYLKIYTYKINKNTLFFYNFDKSFKLNKKT